MAGNRIFYAIKVNISMVLQYNHQVICHLLYRSRYFRISEIQTRACAPCCGSTTIVSLARFPAVGEVWLTSVERGSGCRYKKYFFNKSANSHSSYTFRN